jgi:hypothetical protein
MRYELISRSDLPALPFLITPLLIRRPNFPTIRYIQLIDIHSMLFDSSLNYSNWKLHQLHALLMMIDERLDQLPTTLIKQIVATIRYFIHDLLPATNNAQYRSTSDADDQEHDEQMEFDSVGGVRSYYHSDRT